MFPVVRRSVEYINRDRTSKVKVTHFQGQNFDKIHDHDQSHLLAEFKILVSLDGCGVDTRLTKIYLGVK